MSVCCAAEGNRKCISGPVMAVQLHCFFQIALAARNEPRKRFGNEQPKDGHKNHFKKIHFLFYAIAVAGFAPVGALQWLLQNNRAAQLLFQLSCVFVCGIHQSQINKIDVIMLMITTVPILYHI